MEGPGSIWSRWDLHVHTPASFVQDYGANDDETWERFLADLEALPPEVTTLGINDYLEIDGYKRVRDAQAAGRLQNIELILPVVEFRLARFAGQDQWHRVNYHVIFSDQVDTQAIERELLSSLNSSYKLADGNVWSGPPLRDRLEELGRRIKECAPPASTFPSDLITGFNNFNVEPAAVEDLLRRSDAFEGMYLTAVGMGEWDQLRWTGSVAEKRSIVNRVDFVLTACGSAADFAASRAKLQANTVQSRLLHSSDAHFLSGASEPNRIGRSMTWIKARPSFDGLLLARHEYDDRVFAGTEPRQLQAVRESPTKYLRSVAFGRTSGSGATWFGGSQLDLNPGLVAVIGNKGSGKSALTDAIALVGEADVEEHLSFLSDVRFRQLRTGSATDFECSITWWSGDTERKGLGAHVDRDRPERVRYLPQNYFERLCSEVGDDSYAEFERELKRVVFSWLPVDRRLGKHSLDELIDSTTAEWRERHRLRMGELSEINREISGLERELQPSAESELRNRLVERKRELDVHDANEPPVVDPVPIGGRSPEEAALVEEIDSLRIELAALDERHDSLTAELALLRVKRQRAREIEQRIANVAIYVDQQLGTPEALDALAALDLDREDLVKVSVDRSSLDARIAEVEAAVATNERTSVGLLDDRATKEQARLGLVQQLNDRERALRDEQETRRRWEAQRAVWVGDEVVEGSLRFLEALLAALPAKEGLLRQLESERDEVFAELFDDLARLRDSYRELFAPVQAYLTAEPLLTEGLVMTVDALIRNDGFSQQLLAHVDQSKRGRFFQGGEQVVRDLIARTDFDAAEDAVDFAHGVIDLLRPLNQGRPAEDVEWQFRARSTREQVYDLVFGIDYLSPHYALKFNGKEIAQLSPGERGAALLIFYLLVDKSNLPIILDQPEENLDNETVSRLLVPAIRAAKSRRQVIIVTHNPNLAVYCDADQVVLAEMQRGADTRITYRSGAIEEAQTRKWLVNVLEGTGPAFLKRYAKYSVGKHGQLVFEDH